MHGVLRSFARYAVVQGRSLGWAGALGAALLAFATAFWFSGAQPARERLFEAQRDLDTLRAELARPGRLEPGPRERVSGFYAGFPVRAELPDILLRLHGYALARGVTSQRADYREAGDAAGTPLVRVIVALPVKGRYPQLRAWIADVMSELPQVGLDELRISRDTVGREELEAEARFVVFLRRVP
jgi:Tfp pilus assembly protein PilO